MINRFLTEDGLRLVFRAIKSKYVKKEDLEDNYLSTSQLPAVAKTGDYNDLKNKPVIPGGGATVPIATPTTAGKVIPSGVISVNSNGEIDVSIKKSCGLSKAGGSLSVNVGDVFSVSSNTINLIGGYGISLANKSVSTNNPCVIVSDTSWTDVASKIRSCVSDYSSLNTYDNITIIAVKTNTSANRTIIMNLSNRKISLFGTLFENIGGRIDASGFTLTDFAISGCCELAKEIKAYEILKILSSDDTTDAFEMVLYNKFIPLESRGSRDSYLNNYFGKNLRDSFIVVEEDSARRILAFNSCGITTNIPETTVNVFYFSKNDGKYYPSSNDAASTLTYTISVSETTNGDGTGGSVHIGDTATTTSGEYKSGTAITIYASENSGYAFAGWSDGDTNATRVVSVSSDATYTAIFNKIYTITVSTESGGGIVTGGCEVQYGGSATITATANEGYTFSGWSDGDTSTSRTFNNITSNARYTATFTLNSFLVGVYTYSTDTVSYGTAYIATETTPAGATLTEVTVNYGAYITLKATPNTGYRFVKWTYFSNDGSVREIYNHETVTIKAEYAKTYNAHFVSDISTVGSNPDNLLSVEFINDGNNRVVISGTSSTQVSYSNTDLGVLTKRVALSSTDSVNIQITPPTPERGGTIRTYVYINDEEAWTISTNTNTNIASYQIHMNGEDKICRVVYKAEL